MSRLSSSASSRRNMPTRRGQSLKQLQDQGELDLRGMAVGWRDDRGDVRLDHTVPVARSGAVQGALSGGVVGLILLAPLLGRLSEAPPAHSAASSASWGSIS